VGYICEDYSDWNLDLSSYELITFERGCIKGYDYSGGTCTLRDRKCKKINELGLCIYCETDYEDYSSFNLDYITFSIYNRYDTGYCAEIPTETTGFYSDFQHKDELLHCSIFKYHFDPLTDA
jgi:hypothetical protein